MPNHVRAYVIHTCHTYTHTHINKAHILDTQTDIHKTRMPDTLHKTNMTIVLDTATENAPEDASAAA